MAISYGNLRSSSSSYLKYCLLLEQAQHETKCTIWVQTECVDPLPKECLNSHTER